MKRAGVLLIGMVLLAVVSTAAVQRDLFVKADGSDGTDSSKDFERFWSILSNVSALVVEVNSSPNYDNVHELIKWTRLGEENAGNISALSWKSLQELKDSGVKLYYTESELKEMADEISQEGLPAETVRVLKEQGWTDEQINALVSYIQDHSDEIVEDFDFGAYLEAFSDSFIEVGKKYAEYEAWALEKYYWRNALSDPPSGDLYSNPYVSSDALSKLDHAASTKNADELLLAVNSLRSDVEFVIEDAATAYYTGGGVKFSRVTYSSLGKIVEVYYWPNALKAYRLVSELYAVAVALKEGNSNLWNLVREYQKELSSILGVYLVSTTLPPAPGPSPMPVPFEIGSYSPTSYALGSGSGLVITNVEVVKTDVNFTGGFVKYRVRVDYNVYGGAVIVEWAKFNDGGESKLVNLSTMVYSGQGIIESPEFVVPVGDSLRVPVSGLVKVQYRPATSPGGDTPYARPSDPVGVASVQGDASAYTYSSPAQPVLLMKSYQEVIDLTSQLDPGKVRMEVVPSKDVLYEGDSVSFKLKVENENALPLSGYYTLYAEVPDGVSIRTVELGGGNLEVEANGEAEVQVSTVSYPRPGTYEYFAVFSYDGFQAEDRGSVLVQREEDPGEVYIKEVRVDSLPKEDTTLNFTVKIDNTYPTSKGIKLKLFIDGKAADTLTGVIAGNSERTFTLQCNAEKGDHSYTVKVYWTFGDLDILEDSWTEKISVAEDSEGLFAWLEVVPGEIDQGDWTMVYITVENTADYAQTWPFELVDDTGNVWWPRGQSWRTQNYTITDDGYLKIYAHKKARILTAIGPLYQNTTLHLKLGGLTMTTTYVEVKPANTLKAFMDCSDMTLSAKSGRLVLDMKCDIHFTNPTDIEWSITRIDIDPSRLLATERTKDVTIGIPAETIITRKVVPGGVGEFRLDYHGVLSESNLLQTGWDLKDLAGFKVPVQVNFTVYANGHPYVVTSNGTILDLGYTVTQYVTIDIEKTSITEHIIEDIAIGIAGAYIGAQVGGKVGAIIGTAISPGVGTAAGMATGQIVGGVVGFFLSIALHEKLGWP